MKFHSKHFICSLFVLAIIFLSNCAAKDDRTPAEAPTAASSPSSELLKGVSLSPKSFQADDFKSFFAEAQQAGSIVSWAGDWNELANTQNGGPTVVASLAATYGYLPIIQVQFFTQSTGELLRPLDAATRESYKTSAIQFTEKYHPAYLGLGIEVNMLAEKSPEEFEQFVTLYAETEKAVKEVSPKTKVFPIFQLERMKGLHGGLFGGTNDPAQAEWALLEKFSQAEMFGFTTYPGIIYKDPEDIPADYYTEIRKHTTKPIAFTELGWHSAASPAGWESSEKEQARFVTTFFSLTNKVEKEFVIWSFLYDPAAAEPFSSLGLRNKDGSPRASWDAWVAAK